MYVCMYVCTYVRMYAYMYVCMHICMYVCTVGTEIMLPFRSELRKITSSELHSNFERISIELPANLYRSTWNFASNFVQTFTEIRETSNELRSNFALTSNELRELYSSHGNIISVPTVCMYICMYVCMYVCNSCILPWCATAAIKC